jgi:fatty-acyl-CoA synthase
VPDCFRYGVTYWNYVGEPVHYVLGAIEKQYGGDEARIAPRSRTIPKNTLRTPSATARAARHRQVHEWLGLEDMFELYGSTEAAISTFREEDRPARLRRRDHRPAVKILNERGDECPPAELGPTARSRTTPTPSARSAASPPTPRSSRATSTTRREHSKFRDGVYHSGDLGHVVERDGTRFLYFDGRTDDWIRKDGENFSALQVARLVQEHPDIVLAAAYGVPCAVSDELVMVALKLRRARRSIPKAFFAFCDQQVTGGGMDRSGSPTSSASSTSSSTRRPRRSSCGT